MELEQFNTFTSLIKVLENFRKKHPGKLKLETQFHPRNLLNLNTTNTVKVEEEITKFESRDKLWKEPSITTKSGAVYKFLEVYSRIFIEDYYGNPCTVISSDTKNPDEFKYYLNVPLHNYKGFHKGSVIVAYLPNLQPHNGAIPPHYRFITFREDFEKIYNATDTELVLSCFSQGLQCIADYYIYPSGHIYEIDPDDLWGYTVTLIIL